MWFAKFCCCFPENIPCPQGSQVHLTSLRCYWLSEMAVSWFEAWASCRTTLGGDLAAADSLELQSFFLHAFPLWVWRTIYTIIHIIFSWELSVFLWFVCLLQRTNDDPGSQEDMLSLFLIFNTERVTFCILGKPLCGYGCRTLTRKGLFSHKVQYGGTKMMIVQGSALRWHWEHWEGGGRPSVQDNTISSVKWK